MSRTPCTPPKWDCKALGSIPRNSRLNQRLKRLLINLIALAHINCAAIAGVEAGVEEGRRVGEGGAVGEGRLDLVAVGFAGADQLAVVIIRSVMPPA